QSYGRIRKYAFFYYGRLCPFAPYFPARFWISECDGCHRAGRIPACGICKGIAAATCALDAWSHATALHADYALIYYRILLSFVGFYCLFRTMDGVWVVFFENRYRKRVCRHGDAAAQSEIIPKEKIVYYFFAI